MPRLLKYVAQDTMDLYYQNYKADNDFFDLSDFVTHCGNAITAIYQAFYNQEYQQLRQEKKDEFITFDIAWLNADEIDVKKERDITFAILQHSVMTFPFDKSLTGIQLVLDDNGVEVERTTIQQLFQLKYLPVTNRIFFYADLLGGDKCETGSKIKFANKGICNLKKVRVYYVPSVNDDMQVPDGIIENVIQQTLSMMRAAAEKTVIKKSLDGNQNKILETEMDKKQLK